MNIEDIEYISLAFVQMICISENNQNPTKGFDKLNIM